MTARPKKTPAAPLELPKTGHFIGWKKAVYRSGQYCIVKLRIPRTAFRVMGTDGGNREEDGNRKCRASKAVVISITLLRGRPVDKARSDWDRKFIYYVGKTVTPKKRYLKKPITCASGIHFFMERSRARSYCL